MPVRTGTDRLAGLIPPFIHSFLKIPYPETDGIRYFFAPRPGMRRAAHTKGDSRTAVPWGHCGGQCPPVRLCQKLHTKRWRALSLGHTARIGLHLAEALRKGHTHTEATGLSPRAPSRHAENLSRHCGGQCPPVRLRQKLCAQKVPSLSPGALRRKAACPLPKPCNKACAHRVAGLLPRVPSHLLRKKGQPNGCPLGVSVPGRIRAPCSGSPSDGGSGGLQTALPVYFPPASCRPPGRSHGWQPPGQSPSHG